MFRQVNTCRQVDEYGASKEKHTWIIIIIIIITASGGFNRVTTAEARLKHMKQQKLFVWNRDEDTDFWELSGVCVCVCVCVGVCMYFSDVLNLDQPRPLPPTDKKYKNIETRDLKFKKN